MIVSDTWNRNCCSLFNMTYKDNVKGEAVHVHAVKKYRVAKV
jgi:hypothetical protein